MEYSAVPLQKLVEHFQKMPGIGAKTASQIVLDLKGKLVPVQNKTKADTSSYPKEIEEACAAVSSLGYKQSEFARFH